MLEGAKVEQAGQTDHARLPLATLKAMLTEADQRARTYEADGRQEAATASYGLLLQLLYTLLADDPAPRQGWRDVALRLTDMRQSLPIDALTAAPLDVFHLRVTALSSLPPLLSLERIDEVLATLTTAISWGAPAYNAGAIRECGAIYWATRQALLAAAPTPTLAGWAGYAYALAPLEALSEQAPATTPLSATACAEFAWALRHSFDATLARIDQTGTAPLIQLPQESSPDSLVESSIAPVQAPPLMPEPAPQPARRRASAKGSYRGPLVGVLPDFAPPETLPDQ